MADIRVPKISGFEGYETLLSNVSRLLQQARQSVGRAVNAAMTATYWQIGRRIVEQEQQGSDRASYGEDLVARRAKDLTARFGPRVLADERVSDAAVLPGLSRESPDAV